MEQPARDLERIRRLTWITLLFTVLFVIFFNASKHLPAFARVNVFGEDPFDAVGSFGIQLAAFASLLAIIRLTRPRTDKCDLLNSTGSILRCNLVALASILVTLASDLLALLHDPFVWEGKRAGTMLAVLTVGLFILALVFFALNLRYRNHLLPHPKNGFVWTFLILIISGLILLYFPEKWRSSFAGGIGAALAGMLVLFVATAALTQLAVPIHSDSKQDLVDDLSAVIQKLKTNTKILRGFFNFLNRVVNTSVIHKIILWFDPRMHPWRIILCTAGIIGLTLFFIEAIGEGAPEAQKFALVLSVVIGVESAGVVTGYALFRKYLNIFNAHP